MLKLKTLLGCLLIAVNLFALIPAAADGIPPFRRNPEDSRFNYHATDENSRLRVRVAEQYHLEPGLQAERRNQFAEAYSHWDFILRWVPNHIPVLRKMIDLVVLHKRADLALPYLEEAQAFCPTCASVATVYGIYYQRLGQLDKAIEKYKKALEIDEYSIDAHYNLGLVLVEKGKFTEANEHAQLAYEYGHRLPGLRTKLQKAGAWKVKPVATEEDAKVDAKPDSKADAKIDPGVASKPATEKAAPDKTPSAATSTPTSPTPAIQPSR